MKLTNSQPGATSENVAKDFNVSRQQQDEFAVESYRRAELAQKSGWFDDEIVPISVKKDGKDIVIARDEIRWGTNYEGISKLRPSFPEYGDTTHAGNASQVTDGKLASKQARTFITSKWCTLTSRKRRSCCYTPHETLESPRAEPANTRKVRWHRSRRSPTAYNGYWPSLRHTEASREI